MKYRNNTPTNAVPTTAAHKCDTHTLNTVEQSAFSRKLLFPLVCNLFIIYPLPPICVSCTFKSFCDASIAVVATTTVLL